jgi:hypothetical protein
MKNQARYIIRVSFSQARMQYLDQGKGRLYIYPEGHKQRRQGKQELPRPGMASRNGLAHLQQGRADGAVIRILETIVQAVITLF